ncbi:hypothetical protein E2C01_012492 [Portunus trituberculatus]|uniref:Uncharacterized protein n=1 Tax=Portunus trituberculatus TaxID=210409 RepID=A0A5B7DEV0_PORTR|nr:hypothetical protein [Portunus trituberculatus]
MKAVAAAALLGMVLCCLVPVTFSASTLSERKLQEESEKEAPLSPAAEPAKEEIDARVEEIGEGKEKEGKAKPERNRPASPGEEVSDRYPSQKPQKGNKKKKKRKCSQNGSCKGAGRCKKRCKKGKEQQVPHKTCKTKGCVCCGPINTGPCPVDLTCKAKGGSCKASCGGDLKVSGLCQHCSCCIPPREYELRTSVLLWCQGPCPFDLGCKAKLGTCKSSCGDDELKVFGHCDSHCSCCVPRREYKGASVLPYRFLELQEV